MPARGKPANRVLLGVFLMLSFAVIASIAPALAAAQPAPAAEIAGPEYEAALGPEPRPLLAAVCTAATVTQPECEALVALFSSTTGSGWAVNTNWDNDNDPCGWYGVTCTGSNVTSLVLNGNTLSGTIPSEIGDLTNLLDLNLSSNTLSGPLPATMTSLTALTTFDYSATTLCEPPDATFLAWAAAIVSGGGTYTNSGVACADVDLSVIKDDGLTSVNPGGAVSYTITVSNAGPDGVVGAEVSDTISASLTGATWSCAPTGGAACTAGPVAGDISDTVDIPAGDSVIYTLDATVDLAATGTLSNTASVSIPADVNAIDSNAANDSATDTTSIVIPPTPTITPIPSATGTPTFCEAQISIPVVECDALVAFYNSTNGAGWMFNTGWLINTDPCAWIGVTCSSGNVTRINLSFNDLSGTLPAKLGDLSQLERLSLYFNRISGNIPTEIGNLANLTYLDISANSLSGSIPAEIGLLTSLEYLILRENSLSGSIPSEIGNAAALIEIDFDYNKLTGSLPVAISGLTQLYELDLGHNQLTGTIPSQYGNLSNLYEMDLDNNQLSGSIPPELGNLSNLFDLDLRFNKLTGTIPPELGNLSSLGFLSFYNNQLTGSIPASFSNLSNLYFLSVTSNNLSGSVPSSLGNLKNLEILYLDSNSGLTGTIPQNWTNLTNLNTFLFNDTKLCAPHTTAYINWFKYIPYLSGYWCSGTSSTPISSGGGGTATHTLLLPSNTPTMIGPFQTLTVMAFQDTQLASTPRTATPTLNTSQILKTNIALTATGPAIVDPDATLSYAARTLTAVSMEETVIANGGTPIALVSATVTDTPTPVGGAGTIGGGAASASLFSQFGPCLILPALLMLIGVGIEVYNRYFKNRKKSGEDAFSF